MQNTTSLEKNAFKVSSVGICVSASTLSPITSLLESTGFNDGSQQLSTKDGRAQTDQSSWGPGRVDDIGRPVRLQRQAMMQQEDLGRLTGVET